MTVTYKVVIVDAVYYDRVHGTPNSASLKCVFNVTMSDVDF